MAGAKGHEGEACCLPLIGYQGTRVPAARFCTDRAAKSALSGMGG
jgi:hypothetical protein